MYFDFSCVFSSIWTTGNILLLFTYPYPYVRDPNMYYLYL